jgi:hypothetical protein
MELLHATLSSRLAQKNIYSFVTSPGIAASGITQGKVPVWAIVVFMWIMRMLFVSGVTITPENAACSALFLLVYILFLYIVFFIFGCGLKTDLIYIFGSF